MGTANPVGSDGPVVAGIPIGPCETLSPLFHDALGQLEHSVPDETLLGLDPLEHSGLDHAGPVGRHVAGGPVGPDETLLGLDPLEHSGLDHADPAGQHVAVGFVGCLGWCSQRRKCHGLMEQRVGNNINRFFDAIVSSNGWDNDKAALQLFSHLEGDALNVALLVPPTTSVI